MSSTNVVPALSDISPNTTLAIILGASNYPKTSLSHPVSFATSARRFRNYLTREDGLGIPATNICDLFDTDLSPDSIQEGIANWIEGVRQALGEKGGKPRDLIFYYVGHGSFSNPDQQYILAVRATRKNFEGVSSVKMIDLGATLTEIAGDLRKYIILDCCFAAAAVAALLAPVNDLVQRKTLDSFPPTGTTLLCASDAHDAASAPADLPHTIFSGSMLDVLEEGDSTLETGLSLHVLGQLTRARIKLKYDNHAGLPEVHTPVQTEGNIASLPFFPNAANRPKTLADQIKLLDGRIDRIERSVEDTVKAAISREVAELRMSLQELAIFRASLENQNMSVQSIDSGSESPYGGLTQLEDEMSAELRVGVRRYRTARMHGVAWLVISALLLVGTIVGRLRMTIIISNTPLHNPLFLTALTLLACSFTAFYPPNRIVRPITIPLNDYEDWLKLDIVLAASGARIRLLLGVVDIEDRFLLLGMALLFVDAATAISAYNMSAQ